ncbi:MAG: ribonuclease H-like domain-containing protein, partial [Nanoarchaeota archaeon]|nr:ribonuclease H-like domain-containing protein [Nanoarchaeota archaeon]
DFLNFINNHPDSMLCYYSPKGFDRRLLINSFNEYGLKVQDFTKRKFLDLAVEIKSRFHLPTTYGLKDVSKSLNYNFKYPDMDGFAAAHLYEEDSIKNKSKLINYNKDDLLSMKHIIDVLNKGDIENIKKEFEEIAFPEDISGPIDEDRIVELKNKGYKLQEIADMTGRSVTYIYGRINKKYAPAYLKEEYAEEDKENSFKFKNSRGEKNQKSDMLPIGISWLNSLGFCEQWVYLKYCKKLDFEITERMKEGSKIHEEKEIEFLKHAVPTTWKDFIASEKLVSSREKTVGMILKDVILIGKIDKIEVDKNGVYVIDDKPKPKLYPGIKNQLLTYSVVLKHYLKDALNKSLYAVLKDRDTEEDVWKKKIEDSDEKIVIKTVMRMRGILKDEISPVPTKNINKCRNCVYKHNCEFSIIQTLPSKPI